MFDCLKKYLPIGTVVILKEKNIKVMITGYLSDDEKTSNVYDYSGCNFPQGISSNQELIFFNHEQVDKIYHVGYFDEEVKIYINNLKDEKGKNKDTIIDNFKVITDLEIEEQVDVEMLRFDSNGVVIADGKSDIVEMTDLDFDENGLIISDFS